MVACTFNALTVDSRRMIREHIIGAAGVYEYELELECRTTTYANYTALVALYGRSSKTRLLSGKVRVISPLGTSASLIWNGTTYTNCYIESLSVAEVDSSNLKVWSFVISFVRNTSAL